MTPNQHRLALLPRDGFFAKDGRGWATAARGYALDWPWPTTVRGALTTASGRMAEDAEPFTPEDWDQHAKTVILHRLLALRRRFGCAGWAAAHRMWPAPADALWVKGDNGVRLEMLDPVPPKVRTLGRGAEAAQTARERLWTPVVAQDDKPLAGPRWWDEAAFVAWLCREPVAIDPSVAPGRQWTAPQRRMQTHVGLKADSGTADDGRLFQHEVVETLGVDYRDKDRRVFEEWAIGVEADLPSAAVPPTVRLGSDGRLAYVESGIDAKVFAPPPALIAAFDRIKPRGLRIVIASPTRFANGWLPDAWSEAGSALRPMAMDCDEAAYIDTVAGLEGLGPLRLHAAFVPRPLHVSGWNMTSSDATEHGAPTSAPGQRRGAARGTDRLVAPGAVYFFTRADRRPFTGDDAQVVWKTALGSPGRAATPAAGFGSVVPGIWSATGIEV